MDLFSRTAKKERRGEPLAERMRPVTLEEFVGQRHLLGPGKLLDRLLKAPVLPSLILWGPPGTGKTTLARILAEQRKARFVALSAVQVGVAQLREAIAEARERRDVHDERTILFLDEIHRFNKAQQDALLPHVEAGVITLIGATTENPSFELVSALLSRSTVVRLESLGEEDLRALVDRAVGDAERGLGKDAPEFPAELRDRLARDADGDARRALGIVEIAVNLAKTAGTPVTDEILDEAMQRRTLRYDKGGDQHYDVISAFIKSMRGSDPDAAVYWMARMLEAGEEPRFVLRRMVIFASEDVGNADPRALLVATAAMQAFDTIGMPEGALPMTQCAIYLATAPKSNQVITTWGDARKAALEGGSLAVPKRLRNAPTKLMKDLGFGKGYQYPHDFDGGWVAEDYLPEELADARFYRPTDSGYERDIRARLEYFRKRKEEERKK